MENYTKYALKPEAALRELLADKDDLFVIACRKCFREPSPGEEPELGAFLALARAMGRHITGSLILDFLCNGALTAKALGGAVPEDTKNVVVISCGLGVQTMAALLPLPVYTAADSVPMNGHHGMALTPNRCGACAQCYLNLTGGICPIVDCSKGLVNGQCGGAKNGKCEVDPSKDCAWQKIQQRLAQQGRLEELKAQPVQIRDWSKGSDQKIRGYVKSIRESRLTGGYGGVHPIENKSATEAMPLVRFPEPDTVVINLSQHAGAPAQCLVRVGDHVDVGQKVGQAAGFISANLHASVSGRVIAIEDRPHATRGGKCQAVVIENDKKGTLHPSVKSHGPLEALTPAEIVEIVKEAGVIGMGGAGFPMYVKLMPQTPIDTVLLNGCECEPWLTADHRVLLEFADQVIFGLRAILKAVGAEKGVLVIEDNKPDAIRLMEEKTAGLDDLRVCAVKTKYPQGAEKMLIHNVLGRAVPAGGLPADVGCVVANVSTAKAVGDAVLLGMPLTERVVTVTGPRVKNPGNFLVKIGTSAKELLDYCGGITGTAPAVVKIGGPMMGAVQADADVPITKCSNGVTVYDTDETVAVPCIRCGRCVDVCPMELKPMRLSKLVDAENWAGCKDAGILNCLECRCCEYICSSKIPLVTRIRAGKARVRGMK